MERDNQWYLKSQRSGIAGTMKDITSGFAAASGKNTVPRKGRVNPATQLS